MATHWQPVSTLSHDRSQADREFVCFRGEGIKKKGMHRRIIKDGLTTGTKGLTWPVSLVDQHRETITYGYPI